MRKQLPPKTPDKPRSDWLRSLRGMERSCPECGAKAGQLHAKDCSRGMKSKRGKP